MIISCRNRVGVSKDHMTVINDMARIITALRDTFGDDYTKYILEAATTCADLYDRIREHQEQVKEEKQ